MSVAKVEISLADTIVHFFMTKVPAAYFPRSGTGPVYGENDLHAVVGSRRTTLGRSCGVVFAGCPICQSLSRYRGKFLSECRKNG